MNYLEQAKKNFDEAKLHAEDIIRVNTLELAKAYKQMRLSSCLSLRALGKKIGVSAAFLSDVENGKRGFSEKMYTKLLELYKK